MNDRKITKLIRAGNYVAEVDIRLIEDETGWSPYISKEDASRLDEVRLALKAGDLRKAARWARIFSLTPITA